MKIDMHVCNKNIKYWSVCMTQNFFFWIFFYHDIKSIQKSILFCAFEMDSFLINNYTNIVVMQQAT